MNKKILKIAASVVMFTLVLTPTFALAQVDPNYGRGLDNLELPGKDTNPEQALPDAVVSVINFVLGFLALIAVVIVLIAGFEWMTAGGNEDKVATAKKRLTYGLIGLVIIFVAYAIVAFVIDQLANKLL